MRDAPPTNLPLFPSPLVGRDEELETAGRLLGETRLLTITGFGGIGKTRLAVELAHQQRATYPDGTWIARFSGVTEPDLAALVVLDELGVASGGTGLGGSASPAATTSLGQLQAYLDGKRALLILDHCEHVAAGIAELVDDLARSCPELSFIATSQQPLRAPGERVWTLPPLPVPEPEADEAAIRNTPAVRLFAARAAEAYAEFTLDARTTPAVARICRRLDGSPLAIELAAARVSVLDVGQIADRLDDQFKLLGGGGDHETTHGQTLEAAVAWSYDLLDNDERLAFQRLAVFPATFSAEAAESIAAGGPIHPDHVVDLLAGLIAKSVVLRDQSSGSRRYQIPRTLRMYALARAASEGDPATAVEAHADFFLEFAQARLAGMVGPETVAVFDELDLEGPNIYAALEASIATGNVARALAFISIMGWPWFIRGYDEAVDAARRTLALDGEADAELRSRAQISAALLFIGQGAHSEATEILVQAREERRLAGDRVLSGQAALYLGLASYHQGDLEKASDHYAAAHHAFTAEDAEVGIAWASWFIGWVSRDRGEWDEAASFISSALERFRRLEHPFGIANALAEMGRIHRRRGDLEGACLAHAEALELFRDMGDRVRVAESLGSLAIDERHRGDLALALRYADEGIAVASDLGSRAAEAEGHYLKAETLRQMGKESEAVASLRRAIELSAGIPDMAPRYTMAVSLEALASIAGRGGRHGQAVRLAGAAARRREEIIRPATGPRRDDVDTMLVTARSHLTEDEYGRLLDGGRAMDDDQVVAAALAETDPVAGAEGILSLEQVELGKRVARHLGGVGERSEVKFGGIRVAGRRRRPTGESPPLPIEFRASGWIWLGLGIVGILIWGSLFWWPESTAWWEARDQTVSDWLIDLRTDFGTDVARAFHSLGSAWFWRPIRWASLLVLGLVAKRWRHFFGATFALTIPGAIAELISIGVARPRPFVPIIGVWKGYSHPAVPVVELAATLAVLGLALIPMGKWRNWFMTAAGGLIAAVVVSRVYLGVDHLSDGAVAAIVGPAFAVVIFRLWAPESVFPVTYRRGNTAHLDVGGSRGAAITKAISDQLGITLTDIKPVGLDASGGSTPLRLTVAGDPPTHLFAKLYARSHLRADRWYKVGRTILYGALEDEVSFRTVRRLVEYEDYMFLTMWKANIPSAHPYGVVEITPDREYLIVTEFLHDASEIGDTELDEYLIDDALLIVRRMWDEGLAHRDVKPANVMVADGRVRIIDVAFGTIRPTPWRQAVDLANMMLVLSLNAPAELVYERALQFFAPEDIAEAFAATRGITVPRQLSAELKAHQRDDGIDRLAEFRSLAPDAEPISIQRWSPRRILLALGALLGGLLLLSLIIDSVQGRGLL